MGAEGRRHKKRSQESGGGGGEMITNLELRITGRMKSEE